MLATLSQAARECGDLALRLRKEGLRTTDKDDTFGAHFLTQADEQSQRLGIEIVQEKYPDEAFFAEEGEHAAAVLADCTVFDPLDGTTDFYNGCNEFGVTLCTLRDGQPRYGVMYFPSDGMLIAAERGGGCWINGEQVKLQWSRPVDKMIVGTDIGPWTVHDVLQVLSRQFTVRSVLAAIWGAREVLLGQTGAYWNLNASKIWDAAAGVLAIEEAGGVAYAPDGSAPQWQSLAADWVVAANEELAQIVLAATKRWPGRRK